jgi:diguanylate cyclase (GGDEF)-like protein/PAS domain S-box-containing protein
MTAGPPLPMAGQGQQPPEGGLKDLLERPDVIAMPRGSGTSGALGTARIIGPIRRRASLRPTLLLLGALLVLLTLGGMAILSGQSNLRAAQGERLAERVRLVGSTANYASIGYDPARLQAAANGTGFIQGQTALNDLLLEQFQNTPNNDPISTAVLFAPDGSRLGSFPSSATLTVADLGFAWQSALSGKAAEGPYVTAGGAPHGVQTAALGGARPWAVLAVVFSNVSGQSFERRFGTLGKGPGGLSDVDSRGIAVDSWSAALVGTRIADPSRLAGLRPKQVRTWTTGSGSGEVTNVASPVPSTNTVQVFQQRSAALYDDLRVQQHKRTATILWVLAAALLGVGLFGARRVQVASRAKARLDTLLANAQDLILVVDAAGTLTFVSSAMLGLLGDDPTVWTGRPVTELVVSDDLDRVQALLAEPALSTALNVRVAGLSGRAHWFDLVIADLRNEPAVGGLLLTCHEVDDRKLLEDELSRQAWHDSLTGLPNRASFTRQLDRCHADAVRERQPFAVLFIDLDHFKPVNDRLGHDAGDQVLRTMGARLQASVGADGYVCRFGGDEFGVLLANTQADAACAVASRILEAARAPIAVGTTLVRLDASVGVAVCLDGTRGPEQLVRDADQAMYAAKAAGRGRVGLADTVVASQADGSVPTLAGYTYPSASPLSGRAGPSPFATAQRFPALPQQSRAHTSSRWRRMLPLGVVAVILLGVAAAGLSQERQSERAAEKQLMAERSAFTGQLSYYTQAVADARQLVKPATSAPWAFDNSAIDGIILKHFKTATGGGPDSIVALVGGDGRVIASEPAGALQPFPTTSAEWRTAAAGSVAGSRLRIDGGVERIYSLVPFRNNGKLYVLELGLQIKGSKFAQNLTSSGTVGLRKGGVSVVDAVGRVVVSWNPALLGQQLISREDVVGLPVDAAKQIHPAGSDGQITLVSREPYSIPNDQYLVFQQSSQEFYRGLRAQQTSRDLLLLAVILLAIAMLALVSRRYEESVRRAEDRIYALLHNTYDLLLLVDGDQRISFASSASETLLGWRATDLTGLSPAQLVHADDEGSLLALLDMSNTSVRVLPDVRLRAVDGTDRWFEIHAVDLRHDRRVRGVLLTCYEISERKQLHEVLAYQGQHDELTGLPNRATFASHLEALTERSLTEENADIAVLFLDLDHFKPINDRYGHDAGDEVLKQVALRLRSAIRLEAAESGLRAGGQDLVCRLGGDEFAVVLYGVTEPVVREVAERVLTAIRQPMVIAGDSVEVAATVGVAFSGAGATESTMLVRHADQAMYHAKAAGRGCYSVYAGV